MIATTAVVVVLALLFIAVEWLAEWNAGTSGAEPEEEDRDPF